MKKHWKKITIAASMLLLVLFTLFVLRNSILLGIGNILIDEDELSKVSHAFVLGGGSLDRGDEAARIYKKGWCKKVICVGENVPTIFECLNIDKTESEVAKQNIVARHNVSEDDVIVLKKGTSTKEEIALILSYCQENQLDTIIILSGKFHTNRVRFVINNLFQNQDVHILLHGAPSSNYDEKEWWKSEYGLISCNNEYVKLVYYWLKY